MLVVRDWFPEENWLKTMEKHWKSNPVIVAVDDVVEDLWALDALLEKDGYGDVSLVDDFSRAMDRIRSQNPDLLMVSLSAFCGRGIELVDQIARDPYLKGIPVVALSSPSDNGLRARASALGVVEILPKPYDAVETSLRLRNVLRVKAFQDFLQDENRIVEDLVHNRTKLLVRTRLEVIQRLAKAAEYRDNETGRHVIRVGLYSALMGRGLGLPQEQVDMLAHTAPMHDLGKIGIRDGILLKAGKLTPEEWDTMKTHTLIGYEMLTERTATPADVRSVLAAKSELLDENHLIRTSAMIALTHHEKLDGSGYPFGLRAYEIPLEGRIVAIADVYDALQSERPYKRAFPMDKCLQILRESAGTHVDPMILEVFMDHLDDVRRIQEDYAEPFHEAV